MVPPCNCRGRRHKARCQAKFLGYPEEFNEWPLGWSLYAHNTTQTANGAAARMVFYHYDFEEGGARLNLRGRDKLAQVASWLPTSFAPVVVERSQNNDPLDQARRIALVDALAGGPFPVPAERVMIGRPVATGLSGLEAMAVYGNLYAQTQAQGAPVITGATGGSGLTGAGLTGGVTFGAGAGGGAAGP
jgi:hypothetical protein